jgi:radical SAM modification target selenobiotic family peptide
MESDKLKNLLAGIGLAGLMAGVALTAPGIIHGASG